MSDLTLFDFDAQPAAGCFYCAGGNPDIWKEHAERHLPLTCPICGDVEPNRLLFNMSHCVTLGGSWQRNALVCVSLDLGLNHLDYAHRFGGSVHQMDVDTVRKAGWQVDPVTGIYHMPDDWPDGSHATECVAVAVEDRELVSA